MYSAVVLDKDSRSLLKKKMDEILEQSKGWEKICHHMTIVFGKHSDHKEGTPVELTATDIGISDKAIAFKVKGFESKNKIPHITLAVNREKGGKPFDSNKITDWHPLNKEVTLSGYVKHL